MERSDVVGCGGCGVGFVGSMSAVALWGTSERTRVHLGGGFEGNGTDFSVLWTELPLVAVLGAALPVAALALGALLLRGRRRARSEVEQ